MCTVFVLQFISSLIYCSGGGQNIYHGSTEDNYRTNITKEIRLNCESQIMTNRDLADTSGMSQIYNTMPRINLPNAFDSVSKLKDGFTIPSNNTINENDKEKISAFTHNDVATIVEKDGQITNTRSSSEASSGDDDKSVNDFSKPTNNIRKDKKQKRVRTTFKHHQLIAMKEAFDADKNPDSNALKRLSDKIDLKKRVLQVWFQNARAKYRKGQSIFGDNNDKLASPTEEKTVEKFLVEKEKLQQNMDCDVDGDPSTNRGESQWNRIQDIHKF